jgi:hypothetical protein
MSLTQKQIAEHFGFSVSRASALIKEGMPLESIEAAETWRNARLLRGQRGGVEQRTAIQIDSSRINPDDDFEQTVERHRELKEAARQRYMVARDTSDPQENKLYITYQNILKTLVAVEREALARRLEAKELIKTSHALEKFQKVLAEIKSDLLSLGMDVATTANPENPAAALKAVDERVNKLFSKWSRSVKVGEEDVIGSPPSAQPPDLSDFGGSEEDV